MKNLWITVYVVIIALVIGIFTGIITAEIKFKYNAIQEHDDLPAVATPYPTQELEIIDPDPIDQKMPPGYSLVCRGTKGRGFMDDSGNIHPVCEIEIFYWNTGDKELKSRACCNWSNVASEAWKYYDEQIAPVEWSTPTPIAITGSTPETTDAKAEAQQ